MNLDWTKATLGATVKFLSGGQATIESCDYSHQGHGGPVYSVVFKGGTKSSYGENGWACGVQGHPHDIIEIIPSPGPRRGKYWVRILETNGRLKIEASLNKPYLGKHVICVHGPIEWQEEPVDDRA